MGFHKRLVPELKELLEIHQRCSDDLEFLKRVVGKAEVLMGSKESLEYIAKIQNDRRG